MDGQSAICPFLGGVQPIEGMGAKEKRKKTKIIPGNIKSVRTNENENLVLSPRPGLDCPNASGWYKRLREPISPSSLVNCDQLSERFFSEWTILLSTIIHDLDSGNTAKYSKCHTSLGLFPFSLPEML